MPHVVLAEVVRSEFTEGEHHGSAVVLAGDGSVVQALGDVDAPVFPRSSNKPLQAVGMLRAGLPLTAPADAHLLALAASSHSGEGFHRDGALRLLARGGLTPDALLNARDWPLGEQERTLWQRAGGSPDRLAQNCSGKHAAMLVTCAENGWPVEDYTDPGHPLQRALTEAIADLTGSAPAAVGEDGCGAPVVAVPLTGLAAAFGRLAAADAGPERRVADAMRAHPEWVGGTGRDVTALMRAVPGLVAKDGAEGVYAVGLPDGGAVALKIADGAERARMPVLVALLRRLGVGSDALDALGDVPVCSRGARVGEVRARIG